MATICKHDSNRFPVLLTKFFSLLLLLSTGSFLYAQHIDSLKAALQQASGTPQIILNLQLADAFTSKDWEKSVGYATQAFKLSKKYANDSLIFESCFILSKSYHGLGNYDSALTYAQAALDKSFDARSKASTLHHLGRIYESRSQYEQSLQFYLQAIPLHKSIGNKKGLANTLNSMAFVYKGMEQYDKAVEILKESKTLYEELGNKERLAGVTFNIGLMTMEMNNYAEAIPYFRKAMEGLTEAKEPYKFSSYYNNLANCFEKLLNTNALYYDSALYYGEKNLVLKTQLKDYRGIANAHNVLAATYERNSDYTNSYAHANAALKIADSLKLNSIKKNALSYLVTAEIGLKKLSNVNQHFEEYITVSDKLNDESRSRTLSEMATKYETQKKEERNQQLLMINNQQIKLNWFLGICGIVSLTLLVMLAILFRGKQKVNQKLETQKLQIESSLHEKEALLREIHHRVKNNLQVISSLLNMQSYYLDDPRMIRAIAEGQNRVKAMALIHQKLYQTDHLSEIDFQEYTEQLIGHLSTAFSEPGKNIHSQVNGSALKLDIDTAIPLGLILNELITNAYKYAFSGVTDGSLLVELKQDDAHYYHLRIADSGKGLPADFNEAKLNSLGLKLVRMLIEQLDGSLTVTNESGVCFDIHFKQSKLSA